ncbi:hypothetical protein TTHERM_000277588 (macronuclear) [Tetrahymena thermophila SB210]|uniref:Uncharacterized protein n=1 Tax=Tetrahymena thermophila (strain SB210) TaxID=312017 RepID=W7X924_TETTS|nr:hypothetical protein TTHERM_000277588 [Tetrahymena thermophila SB210]EWS73847.1 hypothetical protein TTHERM_000277588 [Tetrahymena thermophila SB210]|eukprot:XP_012653594.1 hypothetical protein TTHERM_000277588 [Tetrahymena thermophila SB210]
MLQQIKRYKNLAKFKSSSLLSHQVLHIDLSSYFLAQKKINFQQWQIYKLR